MANDLAVLGGDYSLKYLKSGDEVRNVLSKKAYREANSLTAAEARRAYPGYLIEMGVTANGNISALIGSNRIFAQKTKKTERGMVVEFINADDKRFETPADKSNKAAELSKAKAENEDLKAKLAAAEKRAAELEKLATV